MDKVYIEEKGKVKLVRFPIFDKYRDHIVAGFSTRHGSISKGIYKSMNLGFETNDSRKDILENFKRYAGALDINYKSIVMSSQEHHNNIKIVKEEDKGKGVVKGQDYRDIDGLITDIAKLPLATLHADCSSIYYYDPIKKVIGLAHAGWKGTSMEIAGKMIEKMIEEFDIKAEDLIIAIGPSICSDCFEIDEDVKNQFSNMSIDSSRYIKYNSIKDKFLLDINSINKAILTSKGVKDENIQIADICTMESKDMFFSHRGHKGKRGTQAAILQMI